MLSSSCSPNLLTPVGKMCTNLTLKLNLGLSMCSQTCLLTCIIDTYQFLSPVKNAFSSCSLIWMFELLSAEWCMCRCFFVGADAEERKCQRSLLLTFQLKACLKPIVVLYTTYTYESDEASSVQTLRVDFTMKQETYYFQQFNLK